MGGNSEGKSFWVTMPGILTGLAAVIAAVAGLIALFIHHDPSNSNTATASDTSVKANSTHEPSSTIPIVGLVAYYSFDGTAADASGNGQDAIPHSTTATLDRSGAIGKAYEFSGEGQYIEVPDSPRLRFGTDDFTISLWLRYGHQDHSSLGYSAVLIKAADPNSPWAGMSLFVDHPSLGNLNFRVDANNLVTTTDQHLSDNQFHHFALIRNHNVLKVYVDGELASQKDVASINVSNTAPIILGANHIDQTYQNYKGVMDNLRLYNRALNPDEIRQLFRSGQ